MTVQNRMSFNGAQMPLAQSASSAQAAPYARAGSIGAGASPHPPIPKNTNRAITLRFMDLSVARKRR